MSAWFYNWDSWSQCAEWITSKYHKRRLPWISSDPPDKYRDRLQEIQFTQFSAHKPWLIRRHWSSNCDKTQGRYCLDGNQARQINRARFNVFAYLSLLPAVCTHELLRCAADCTGTQRPVYETPIITAPFPAALEPDRGSSRMLLQVGPFPNVSDGSRS
jgi:hypothetical protein